MSTAAEGAEPLEQQSSKMFVSELLKFRDTDKVKRKRSGQSVNTTVLDAEAAPWWQLAASPPTPKPLSQPELPILGVGSLMMRITSYGPAAGHPSYFRMILNLPYLPTYLTYFPLHHVPHILYADTTLGPTSPFQEGTEQLQAFGGEGPRGWGPTRWCGCRKGSWETEPDLCSPLQFNLPKTKFLWGKPPE